MTDCPLCGKKVRYRTTWENYFCGKCGKLFDKNLKEIKIYGDVDPLRAIFDDYGNQYKIETKLEDNKIYYTKIYFLPEGKKTLKGPYQKKKPDNKCKYLERQDCDHGYGYKRCEFLEFVDVGNWKCTYEKKSP